MRLDRSMPNLLLVRARIRPDRCRLERSVAVQNGWSFVIAHVLSLDAFSMCVELSMNNSRYLSG